MKKMLLCLCAALSLMDISAQHFTDLKSRNPKGEWENVSVEKIADDSLSTTFMLWIRGGVKHHFHETHTESVFILEGEGRMDLGDKSFDVKAGDYILIPRNTVHAVTATSTLKVLSIQTPRWVVEDRKFVEPIRRPHNE
jgi:mannose-6-phosphate isomerase-like protein (cupin superfamily)